MYGVILKSYSSSGKTQTYEDFMTTILATLQPLLAVQKTQQFDCFHLCLDNFKQSQCAGLSNGTKLPKAKTGQARPENTKQHLFKILFNWALVNPNIQSIRSSTPVLFLMQNSTSNQQTEILSKMSCSTEKPSEQQLQAQDCSRTFYNGRKSYFLPSIVKKVKGFVLLKPNRLF